MDELIELLSKYRDDVSKIMQDMDLLFIDTALSIINDDKYDFYKFDKTYLASLLDSAISEEEIDIIYIICNGKRQGIDTKYDDFQLGIVRRIVDKLKKKRIEINNKYASYREDINIVNAFISSLSKGELPYVDGKFFDKVFRLEKISYAKANSYLMLLLQKNEEMVKENNSLLDVNYQYVFDYYNIDKNVFSDDEIIELMDKYNVDELNELFSLFNGIVPIILCNKNSLLKDTLLNTSIKRVRDIIDICNKYLISLSELGKHLSLLTVSDDNKEYDNFVCNVSIIQKMKMNVAFVFKSNFSLLVMDHQLLLKNINIYALYGLEINYNSDKLTSTCLTGLSATNVLDNMDRFIEMGAYDYIRQNQSRLRTHDSLLFYKGYYARKKGISFINSFANTSKLYMENSTLNGLGINKDNYRQMTMCIDPYIDNKKEMLKFISKANATLNVNILSDDILFGLEEYKVNDFLYNIEGVLVSRLKVIRIFRSLASSDSFDIKNMLMFALCYKKIMDQRDFDVLYKVVNCLVEERHR